MRARSEQRRKNNRKGVNTDAHIAAQAVRARKDRQEGGNCEAIPAATTRRERLWRSISVTPAARRSILRRNCKSTRRPVSKRWQPGGQSNRLRIRAVVLAPSPAPIADPKEARP